MSARGLATPKGRGKDRGASSPGLVIGQGLAQPGLIDSKSVVRTAIHECDWHRLEVLDGKGWIIMNESFGPFHPEFTTNPLNRFPGVQTQVTAFF